MHLMLKMPKNNCFQLRPTTTTPWTMKSTLNTTTTNKPFHNSEEKSVNLNREIMGTFSSWRKSTVLSRSKVISQAKWPSTSKIPRTSINSTKGGQRKQKWFRTRIYQTWENKIKTTDLNFNNTTQESDNYPTKTTEKQFSIKIK